MGSMGGSTEIGPGSALEEKGEKKNIDKRSEQRGSRGGGGGAFPLPHATARQASFADIFLFDPVFNPIPRLEGLVPAKLK